MARIILIETSTALCSTALIEDGKIADYRESSQPRAHAALTAPFVHDMLADRGLKVSDCDAVCLSKGPGSYTGLRVGSSTAKGLCFGAGIPLISVGTLELLVWQAMGSGLVPEGCTSVVPMIDARRMEVYAATFDIKGGKVLQTGETAPVIVDAGSYSELLEKGKVLFVGDGAGKCSGTITNPNAVFAQVNPRADAMLVPALQAFEQKRFEDTAYFEPFYLKQFIATVSKKQLF